jgi:membrane fusion protein (multidrug efflux system)
MARVAWLAILLLALAASPALAQQEDTSGVRAQLTAHRSAVLSAGVPGLLSRLAVREGDEVAANAPIATIDCSSQSAQRRVAEARLTGARAKVRVNERLGELNSASVLEVELARAEAATAAAEIAAIDTTLRKCEIRAPFAGVVVARMAAQHQHVREGEPLIELVDPSSLEIEMVVPARWLQWLKPDLPFELVIEDQNRTAPATVARIGGRIDPVAQTVRVIGALRTQTRGLLPGMSGTVRFP